MHVGSRLLVGVGVGATTLLVLGFMPFVWSDLVWRWAVRSLSAVCFAGTAIGLARSPRRILLLSPIYLLGVIAFLFYSLVPAVYVALFFDPAIYPFDLRVLESYEPVRDGVAVLRSHGLTVPFVGSVAEWMILQFALLCLVATHVVYALSVSRNAVSDHEPEISRPHRVTSNVIVAIGLLVSLGVLVSTSLMALPASRAAQLWREVFDAAPVLATFCLVYAAFATRGGQRKDWLRLGILAIASVGSLSLLVPKRTVGMIAVATGIVLMGKRITPVGRRMLIGGLIGAIVLVMSGVMLSRGHVVTQIEGSATRFAQAVAFYGAMKGVFRQGESGYCLKSVIAEHWSGSDRDMPFYFVQALMPRVIWPAKPSLSRGDEYAVRYCGYGPLNPGSVHSASITLLGEPIIYGGPLGLAFAAATIVLSLSALSAALIYGSALGRMVVVALVPLLVDFDQSYALYLAIAVKSALTMLPLVFLCAHLDRYYASS